MYNVKVTFMSIFNIILRIFLNFLKIVRILIKLLKEGIFNVNSMDTIDIFESLNTKFTR